MKQLKKYFKLPSKSICIVYGVSFALIFVAFFGIYFTFGKQLTAFVSDTQSFNAWLGQYKSLSAVIFVLIRAFQTVIKIIPAEPLEIASGYAFGTWGGLFYCSLGTFLGSLVIVLLSKTFGSAFINAFVNEEQFKQLKLVSDTKNQNVFLWIFYLIPGTPKDIFTYIVSATDINLVRFFAITTIARIPSIITSTICGNELSNNNTKTAIIVFAATAVVSFICGMIYKKYNKKQRTDIEIGA